MNQGGMAWLGTGQGWDAEAAQDEAAEKRAPSADAADTQHVAIDMTMTSPACPAGPQLIADTKRAVGGHGDVSAVEVRIVMDPPWTPDRMTDAARDQLGIF